MMMTETLAVVISEHVLPLLQMTDRLVSRSVHKHWREVFQRDFMCLAGLRKLLFALQDLGAAPIYVGGARPAGHSLAQTIARAELHKSPPFALAAEPCSLNRFLARFGWADGCEDLLPFGKFTVDLLTDLFQLHEFHSPIGFDLRGTWSCLRTQDQVKSFLKEAWDQLFIFNFESITGLPGPRHRRFVELLGARMNEPGTWNIGAEQLKSSESVVKSEARALYAACCLAMCSSLGTCRFISFSAWYSSDRSNGALYPFRHNLELQPLLWASHE